MPAVADSQPDVAGGTVARLEMAGLSKAALQVVWTSGLLRYGPHAVRSDLDPEAKRRLTAFFIKLKSMSPDVFFWNRNIPAASPSLARRITRWLQPSCAWCQVTADSNGGRSRARSFQQVLQGIVGLLRGLR